MKKLGSAINIVHYSGTLSIMLLIAARCQTIDVLVLSIAEYSEIIDNAIDKYMY